MSTRAGELDWLARWRDMQSAAEAAHGEGEHVAGEDRWKYRAARFDRQPRLLRWRHRSARHHRPRVDVVADLGAGTGRHVLALAPRCAQVLAVEPSAAMRARMEARIAEDRIQIIAWPGTAA